MHLAILGGTRFIGHAAGRMALERGHRVSVLHRGRHPCEIEGALDLLVDRGDPSALCRELVRLAPDVVVDTRAMTRADAQTTALALKLARARAVVLSSMDVYAQFGRLNGLPAPEPESVVSERSPLTVPYPFRGIATELPADYDKKDVEAELAQAVERDGLDVIVLRLPAVYGARDYRRRFGAFVDRLDAGQREIPCVGGAAWRQTHAHVRDVAQAIVLAAEARGAGFRIFNVGEAQTPTMRERCQAIAREMDVDVDWAEQTEALPDDLEWLGRMPNDLVVSSTALRQALGFREVTTPAERVRDLVDWLRRSRVSPGSAAPAP